VAEKDFTPEGAENFTRPKNKNETAPTLTPERNQEKKSKIIAVIRKLFTGTVLLSTLASGVQVRADTNNQEVYTHLQPSHTTEYVIPSTPPKREPTPLEQQQLQEQQLQREYQEDAAYLQSEILNFDQWLEKKYQKDYDQYVQQVMYQSWENKPNDMSYDQWNSQFQAPSFKQWFQETHPEDKSQLEKEHQAYVTTEKNNIPDFDRWAKQREIDESVAEAARREKETEWNLSLTAPVIKDENGRAVAGGPNRPAVGFTLTKRF
jgi:hypothetical protein